MELQTAEKGWECSQATLHDCKNISLPISHPQGFIYSKYLFEHKITNTTDKSHFPTLQTAISNYLQYF